MAVSPRPALAVLLAVVVVAGPVAASAHHQSPTAGQTGRDAGVPAAGGVVTTAGDNVTVNGTNDTAAPVVHSLEILNESVEAGETLAVRVNASDRSGIVDLDAFFRSASGQTISVDRQFHDEPGENGTYLLTRTLPENVVSGTYELDRVLTRDTLDNDESVKRFEGTVDVSGVPDAAAPTVHSLTVLNESVAAGETLAVRVNVSDQTGIVDLDAFFRSAGGQTISVDRQFFDTPGENGTHLLTREIPDDTPSGTYELDRVLTRDTLDNDASIRRFDGQVNVSGVQDTAAPVIHSLEILNESVAAGELLAVRVNVSDESGIVDLDAQFRANGQTISVDRQFHGAPGENGTHLLTRRVPEDTPAGAYELDHVLTRDTLDNDGFFSNVTALLAGEDPGVEVPELSPVCPGCPSPTDPDGDGQFEDVDGDGRTSFADVLVLFEHLESAAVRDDGQAFDFNGNGRVDFADVVALFEAV